jgi:Tfp pilus assembly protein PilP
MRYLSLLVVLALVGCDAGSAPLGEPVLQVVSGDGQSAPAAEQDTIQPVRARLGRLPAEGVAGRFGLVRNLYAQTIVQGIAGEQVCSHGIGDAPLIAWNQCDITDAAGGATFFYEPGTIAADSSCAEIRAVVDGAKVVTDVVCVRVDPGPYVGAYEYQTNLIQDSIATIDASLVRDGYGNLIPYRLVSLDTLITVLGDTIGTVAARTIRWPQDAIGSARDSLPDGICGQIEIEAPQGVIADSANYTILVNSREMSIALGKPNTSSHLCD